MRGFASLLQVIAWLFLEWDERGGWWNGSREGNALFFEQIICHSEYENWLDRKNNKPTHTKKKKNREKFMLGCYLQHVTLCCVTLQFWKHSLKLRNKKMNKKILLLRPFSNNPTHILSWILWNILPLYYP